MSELTPGLITSLSIGLRGKDFVIVGVSKRSIYGPMIVTENATLIKTFGNNIIVAFSGHVPDIQYMFRELQWFFQREKLKRERDLSVEEIAKYTGIVLFSYKLFPNIAFGIIGGIDLDEKPKLFDLDPFGSILEEEYVASGISADIAYGLLEMSYREDMTFDEAKDLVIKSIRSVAKRNVLVGQYAEIAYVDGKNKKPNIETIKLL